jgi:hypothetical protein
MLGERNQITQILQIHVNTSLFLNGYFMTNGNQYCRTTQRTIRARDRDR